MPEQLEEATERPKGAVNLNSSDASSALHRRMASELAEEEAIDTNDSVEKAVA